MRYDLPVILSMATAVLIPSFASAGTPWCPAEGPTSGGARMTSVMDDADFSSIDVQGEQYFSPAEIQLELSREGWRPGNLEPAVPPTDEQLVKLAQVFGTSLHFEDIDYWISPVEAISPFTFVVKRNIFFPSDKIETRSTGHLAHEFTHVWQQRRGGLRLPQVVREMLSAEVCNPGQGCYYDTSTYDFYLDPNEAFLDYSMEQQACIVETFYLLWFENAYSEHCLNCAELGRDTSLAIAESLVRQEIY